jgi:thiamine kinase-like enzyme
MRPALPRLLEIAGTLEEAVGPTTIVFGHNDLLAANIMDDGRRLWLIDWEYAGFNSPLFDLANLASNNDLDADAVRRLLEGYFGRGNDRRLVHAFSAMRCASLLREAMWSMVSEIHSTLDFDYAAYTAENLARFETALATFDAMHP